MIKLDDIFIPLRMLNEFVYCPRLFWLEFVENQFTDSEDTIRGRFIHRNVDKPKPLPEEIENKGKARSVFLQSEKYGISGKLDLLELENGSFYPVEYKSGSMNIDGSAWDTDLYQIAAQALLLRDNGYECHKGYIYYDKNRKRLEIIISEELLESTLLKIAEIRKLLDQDVIPDPLEDSPKCIRCSLAAICLPDETKYLSSGYLVDLRRLYPARDNTYPMYVREQGTTIGKKNNQLIVRGKETNSTVSLIDISSLSIFGNIQITTQALHELLQRNIPICYFSLSGWFYGVTAGNYNKNGELRVAQYKTSIDIKKSLSISKAIVAGKIKNSRTLLRRNGKSGNETALKELQNLIDKTAIVETFPELLGTEGNAARIYFSKFSTMLKQPLGYNFENRNRRPPLDPVNALLSYIYSLLVKDVFVSLTIVGLDPYVGFFHRMKYGKPALALDLMEEYRSIVCDSVVIGLINNSIIKESDFISSGKAVAIEENARKKVIQYYENRMDTLIRHPIFGYTVSYRRTIEVQARLLSRYVNGEINEYIPLTTR